MTSYGVTRLQWANSRLMCSRQIIIIIDHHELSIVEPKPGYSNKTRSIPWALIAWLRPASPLHWRHNDHDGVSNHQPHGCLLNRLFQAQIKENIKAPRHWPLCGEFTGTGEFPAQRASNAANVSIWWRHHESICNHSIWLLWAAWGLFH